MNVILINSSDISKIYGIGSYLNYLKDELTTYQNINLIFVDVEIGTKGKVTIKNLGYQYMNIVLTHEDGVDTEASLSKIIFHLIILNTNVVDGIFHINSPMDLELAKVARENGFKVVFTMHIDLSDYVNFYNGKIYYDFFPLVDGSIFITEESRQFAIRKFLIKEENTCVIPNGIKWNVNRKSKLKIKRNLGFGDHDFIVLFVGRLERSKGVFDLVEAFKLFSNNNPNKKLILIGTGKFQEILKITKDSLNNFYFTGFLTKRELSYYYKIADVGVLVSYSEQMSLVVTEMIHNKIPLILSNIRGFNFYKETEVIKVPINKINSIYKVDITKLNDSLKFLYENDYARKKLVDNTLHYKRKTLNNRYTVAQIVKFYEKIQ
ncbi:glycosyltransferase family 4 protein [Sphingobacterium lactis]|uniref:glycosyltransferase family 4 protein n=1 Tax=Sphingobacterium lactis TaxID=797291 RepID=UPI003EC67B4D